MVETRTPLSFVVELGQGDPLATSYVSTQEADDYMDRVLDSYKTVWIESDEYKKQQMLIWGTQLFDEYVYFPSGYSIRTYMRQALQFPRAGLVDYDGYTIDHRSIPTFVKQATIQMGFELGKVDRTSEATRGIVQATVGPLSVTFDQNYSHSVRAIPRGVRSIVARFGGAIRGDAGLKFPPLYRA